MTRRFERNVRLKLITDSFTSDLDSDTDDFMYYPKVDLSLLFFKYYDLVLLALISIILVDDDFYEMIGNPFDGIHEHFDITLTLEIGTGPAIKTIEYFYQIPKKRGVFCDAEYLHTFVFAELVSFFSLVGIYTLKRTR